MDSGLLVEAALEMLGRGGGLSRCLTDEMQRRGRLGLGGFLFVESVLTRPSFTRLQFLFLRNFFRWKRAARGRMAKITKNIFTTSISMSSTPFENRFRFFAGSFASFCDWLSQGFLGGKFDGDIKGRADGIVNATIEIYERISKELLPTPARWGQGEAQRERERECSIFLMLPREQSRGIDWKADRFLPDLAARRWFRILFFTTGKLCLRTDFSLLLYVSHTLGLSSQRPRWVARTHTRNIQTTLIGNVKTVLCWYQSQNGPYIPAQSERRGWFEAIFFQDVCFFARSRSASALTSNRSVFPYPLQASPLAVCPNKT